LRPLLHRAWHSTTVTSWASQFARTASLLLVLPMVLRQFSAAEVAAWYLLMGMINTSALADFGFRATFIRAISFGLGGARSIEIFDGRTSRGDQEPNWDLIERITSTMERIYTVLSVVVLLLLASVGSLAMLRPLGQLVDPTEGWICWAIVCVTAVVEFQGRVYSNYLDGLNHVALVRRIDTVAKLGAIFTSFAVMLWAPSLLNLVLANRAWAIFAVVRDLYMVKRVNEGRWNTFRKLPVDRELSATLWRPAWRSGVSGILSTGLTNLTGLIYAQFATSSGALAAYLFAVKLVSEVRNVALPPLYAKVPLLGRLRAQGDMPELTRVVERGINLSYVVFLAGVIGVGFGAEPLLHLIGSQTAFVPQSLWWLLSIGYLAQRIGGMHLQVHQTTNEVVAHIWDGVAGGVFVIAASALLAPIGVYAFPIAVIIGYLGIHAWVAMLYSYRSLSLLPPEYIRRFVLPPAASVTLLVLILLLTL